MQSNGGQYYSPYSEPLSSYPPAFAYPPSNPPAPYAYRSAYPQIHQSYPSEATSPYFYAAPCSPPYPPPLLPQYPPSAPFPPFAYPIGTDPGPSNPPPLFGRPPLPRPPYSQSGRQPPSRQSSFSRETNPTRSSRQTTPPSDPKTLPQAQQVPASLPRKPPAPNLTDKVLPQGATYRNRDVSPLCLAQLSDQHRLRIEPRFRTSSMSATDEYGAVLREISGMTVDKLKNSLRRLNEQFYTHLKYSGLKNELYTRLRAEVDRYYNHERYKFPIVKQIIYQCYRGYNGMPGALPIGNQPTPNYRPANPPSSSTGYNNYGASTSTSTSAHNPSYGGPGRPVGGVATGATTGTSAGLPRFNGNAYAADSARLGGGGSVGATINRWQNDDVPIKFRPSPFYRVEKSLSPPVTLYKADQGDRKVATMTFALTEAQRTLINSAKESSNNPQYEVRLYCTSDNNYSIGRPHASQFPAPIEFPQTSEIKLNNVTLNVNTKGIKKQPGTTPPVNLTSKKGPSVNMGPGQLNKVELIYTHTDKTTYYMVAYLVETTSVQKIVERVKVGRTKPKEEVIQTIINLNSDEDIAVGTFELTLRDPLSFVRIGVPIRARTCNHIDCFDAETWFELNEQTPTWSCPICNKTVKYEDIVVDGYFEDVLKTCPSACDKVDVSPDGTWRPKYDNVPSNSNSDRRASPRGGRDESTKPDISGENRDGNGNGEGKGKTSARPEALTLDSDSDDDDQPLSKRPRIGGFSGGPGAGGESASHSGSPFLGGAGTNGVRNGRGTSEVLDLTLSDSDEEPPAPAPRPPQQPVPPPISRQHSSYSSNPMARSTSGGAGDSGGVKTIADVQRDIDAMQQRMRDEYGDDWRSRFNV